MNILLVLAHPLKDSLNAHLAQHLHDQLQAEGHKIRRLDLYAEDYAPALTADEAARYGKEPAPDTAALQEVEVLVMVFPTWWFGLPAILKGWVDRSFRPGAAFEVGDGKMTPLLTRMRHVLIVTTLGTPWWIDWLVMWRPLARSLRFCLFRPCAPQARVKICSLYQAEQVTDAKLSKFRTRLNRVIQSYRGTTTG